MSQPFDPAQSFPPAPPAAPNHKFALWALILGIAAIFLSLFVIGGLFGLIAAILAIVALVKPGPKGKAIAGLVTGVFSIGIAFIALFVWIGVVAGMSQVPRARMSAARAQIAHLRNGINTFEIDIGRYPTSAEGLNALLTRPAGVPANEWHGPYIYNLSKDPWGHDYIYKFPGTKDPQEFELFSPGPDGIPDTTDDITSG